MTSTELEAALVPGPLARRVTDTDKAWMAAVVDMKGSVIAKKNQMRRTPQFVLYVSTKESRVAVRLSALTGTAPEQHPSPGPEKFTRRACAEHCPSPHVHVEESPWSMPMVTRWSVTGIAMAVVLLNLAPYMSTFDDYRETLAEILANTPWSGPGSGSVRATAERLTQLGWRIPAQVARKIAEGRSE